MENKIKQLFSEGVKSIISLSDQLTEQDLTLLENDIIKGKFSDYQYNGLPRIMSIIKKKQIDQQININTLFTLFTMINNYVIANSKIITRMELSKVFINIYLDDQYVLSNFLNGDEKVITNKPEKILIDYSSPNVAKSLHIGHLRSTIIGESVYRFLKLVGHNVIGINHVGDWGTQFGMLLNLIKTKYGDNAIDELNQFNSDGLTELYREAKAMFDKDDKFKSDSRNETHKLQQGDKQNQTIWKKICEISEIEYNGIYNKLNITGLTLKGESFYQNYIPDVVKLLDQAGLIQESDGAKIIKLDDFNFPLMVVKSDGGYTYDTTDLTALHYRLTVEKADRIIYVTDKGQYEHFNMCFKVAIKMGWVTESEAKTKLIHIGFGLVMGKDNKKLKTRSGEIVRLVDVMDDVKQYARDILEKKILDKKTEENYSSIYHNNINNAKKDHLSETIGYNTLKYFDLSHTYECQYKYDHNQMFRTDGNTAMYLLYSYARINSIIENSKFVNRLEQLEKDICINNMTKEEKEIIIHMLSYNDIKYNVMKDYKVTSLIDYLYDLSKLFNSFYCQKDGKIVNGESEQYRVYICKRVRDIMSEIFHIVNITSVDHV